MLPPPLIVMQNGVHVEIKTCINLYRYLQGSDPEMKARMKYLWPIVHYRLIPSAAILLAFTKGIFARL
jgi:hypothetical protein